MQIGEAKETSTLLFSEIDSYNLLLISGKAKAIFSVFENFYKSSKILSYSLTTILVELRYFLILSVILEGFTYKIPLFSAESKIFKIKKDLKTGLYFISSALKFNTQAISSNLEFKYN